VIPERSFSLPASLCLPFFRVLPPCPFPPPRLSENSPPRFDPPSGKTLTRVANQLPFRRFRCSDLYLLVSSGKPFHPPPLCSTPGGLSPCLVSFAFHIFFPFGRPFPPANFPPPCIRHVTLFTPSLLPSFCRKIVLKVSFALVSFSPSQRPRRVSSPAI